MCRCVCAYKPYQSLAYENLFTVSISLCLLFFAIVHFITFYSYSLSSLYIFLSYVYYTTVYVLMLLSREYIIIYVLSEPETEFLSLNSVTHTHGMMTFLLLFWGIFKIWKHTTTARTMTNTTTETIGTKCWNKKLLAETLLFP